MDAWIARIVDYATTFGFRIAGAVLIFALGAWGARILKNLVRKVLAGRAVDPTLTTFFINAIHVTILVFVSLAALDELGVKTTSFIAVMGAAGLAVGLALQGSLSNFAAGILLIAFRPFQAGDHIEAGNISGTVEEIQILTTLVRTPDNRTIVVPNGKLTADSIVNHTCKGTRRLDLTFTVGADSDIDTVKRLIEGALERDSRVLPEPAPVVGVLGFADRNVQYAVRPWIRAADYATMSLVLPEIVRKALIAEGIDLPALSLERR